MASSTEEQVTKHLSGSFDGLDLEPAPKSGPPAAEPQPKPKGSVFPPSRGLVSHLRESSFGLPGSRKRRARTSHINLLITGQPNSGKSTFLQTFLSTLPSFKIQLPPGTPPDHGITSPLPLHPTTVPTASLPIETELEGERISLQFIQTPSLPHPHEMAGATVEAAIDGWARPILDFVEGQFESMLVEESKVKRNPKSPNMLVHACLFFLDAVTIFQARGLSDWDVEAMKQLCWRINLVPCLAKIDLLTVRQKFMVKIWVRRALALHRIPIYMFHDEDPADEDDDEPEGRRPEPAGSLEGELKTGIELMNMIPFALFNPEVEPADPTALGILVDGALVFGREYPTGVLDVTNAAHSDFVHLRNGLLVSHLAHLKALTKDVYYENWRTNVLQSSFYAGGARLLAVPDDAAPADPAARVKAQPGAGGGGGGVSAAPDARTAHAPAPPAGSAQ